MNDHDGPGVVPGRYAGEAILIHEGSTPELIAAEEQRRYADGLAGRISAAAAEAAPSQYVLLELLGEFDAIGAIRYWNDFKSLAHWLSWACSMTPGVAREHVRVAKALRRMPTIAGLFWCSELGVTPRPGIVEMAHDVPIRDSMMMARPSGAELRCAISRFGTGGQSRRPGDGS